LPFLLELINLCPYITSWVEVTRDKKGTERAYVANEHKINLCTGTADLENADIPIDFPMDISKGTYISQRAKTLSTPELY
jgi:hypothetical protein